MELDPALRLNQLINIKWKNPLSLDQWSKIFNVKNTLIQKWSKNQNIINDKNFLFNKIILEKSKRRALDTLADFHSKNPYKKSILRDELIGLLGFGKKWFESRVLGPTESQMEQAKITLSVLITQLSSYLKNDNLSLL